VGYISFIHFYPWVKLTVLPVFYPILPNWFYPFTYMPTLLVTCPCRCQSLYFAVCPVGVCVCFCSLLSCLIIIKLSHGRPAWCAVGFSGSPLPCLFTVFACILFISRWQINIIDNSFITKQTKQLLLMLPGQNKSTSNSGIWRVHSTGLGPRRQSSRWNLVAQNPAWWGILECLDLDRKDQSLHTPVNMWSTGTAILV